MVNSRKQSMMSETERVILLVIRTGHWFSPNYFSATRRKQSSVAHSDTLRRSLIKSMQSMQSPEQISTEHKLPFCGHRCLLDHCVTKREMNVKCLLLPFIVLGCRWADISVSVSQDSFCFWGSFHSPLTTMHSWCCRYTVDKLGWCSSLHNFSALFYYCSVQIIIYIIVNILHFCLKTWAPELHWKDWALMLIFVHDQWLQAVPGQGCS